ncbi:MAG: metal-dependent hydrolase [Bilophila wadsworthia]|jgi:L-ascorbate metabolism protein UlaG (beta-lactamase superfamily)
MSVSVTWYGHSNFKVSCGDVTVFIDPFFTHNPSCPVTWNEAGKPDLVLVTHDHGDHTGDAVAICKSSGATCGCIVGTAERLIDAGMPQASIPAGIGFNIGGTIEVKGVRVTMTQAFHTSESGAPTGYVVTMPDGFAFYHAGDTGLFSSMELIGSLYPLDLALLPVGGFFTMDGLQAAHAARLLKPKAVIPMHWGTFPVLAKDTSAFASHLASVAPDVRLISMKPGDSTAF